MLFRGEFVLKEISSILERSWTLPNSHHLGAKDVTFGKCVDTKECAYIFKGWLVQQYMQPLN